ncbi:hypothetical protein HDU96_004038 [Phlyctochytrium bullatum]|nr:hypothetical protein HDU96_004038 [Phlyctochytrium bullatum]
MPSRTLRHTLSAVTPSSLWGAAKKKKIEQRKFTEALLRARKLLSQRPKSPILVDATGKFFPSVHPDKPPEIDPQHEDRCFRVSEFVNSVTGVAFANRTVVDDGLLEVRLFLKKNPCAKPLLELFLTKAEPVRRVQSEDQAHVLLQLLPLLRLPAINKRIFVRAFKSCRIADIANHLALRSHPHLFFLDLLVIGSRTPNDQCLTLAHRIDYVKRQLARLCTDLDSAFGAHGAGGREDLDRRCGEREQQLIAKACDGKCRAQERCVERMMSPGGLLEALCQALKRAVSKLWFMADAPVDVLELLFQVNAGMEAIGRSAHNPVSGRVAASRAIVMARGLLFDIMETTFETQEPKLHAELERWFFRRAKVIFAADRSSWWWSNAGTFDVVVAEEKLKSDALINTTTNDSLFLIEHDQGLSGATRNPPVCCRRSQHIWREENGVIILDSDDEKEAVTVAKSICEPQASSRTIVIIDDDECMELEEGEIVSGSRPNLPPLAAAQNAAAIGAL